MKVMIWNIRGMGKKARVRQLKEMISREDVDILGVQETIKIFFIPQSWRGWHRVKAFRGIG
jgi:exonuclease III